MNHRKRKAESDADTMNYPKSTRRRLNKNLPRPVFIEGESSQTLYVRIANFLYATGRLDLPKYKIVESIIRTKGYPDFTTLDTLFFAWYHDDQDLPLALFLSSKLPKVSQ